MIDAVELQKKAMPRPAGSPSWLPFLDGVRGYMALWVMVGHAGWLCGNRIPILTEAQLAVNVFMILSGLLMAHHFLNRQAAEPWESPTTWQVFYTRRFLRIAPLYYLLIAVAFLFNAQYSGMLRSISEAHVPDQLYLMDAYALRCRATVTNVLMHFSFLFGFCPRYANTTALPDWSIGLEMQFYLAFPFLMLAIRRFGPLLVVVPLLLLQTYTSRALLGSWGDGSASWDRFLQPTFLPFKIGFFLGGMLLAFAYHRRNQPGQYALYLLLAAFCVAWGSLHSMVPILTIGIGALLFLPPDAGRDEAPFVLRYAQRFLMNRVSRFFGDISYGVYLLHLLIMEPIAVWLFRQESYLPLASSTVRMTCLVAMVTPPLLLLSWLAHRFIERPGIELGKRLAKSRRAAPPASAVAVVARTEPA